MSKKFFNVAALNCVVFSVLAINLGVHAAESEPPPAPQGFAWKKFESIGAMLLVPEGWHVKQKEEKGTQAIFITKENIDEKGRFESGLSLNVVKNLKGKSAPDAARDHIATLSKQNDGQRTFMTGAGKLKGFGCLVKAKAPDGSGFVQMHCLAFGNTETNTLYLIAFEAPAEKWEDAWKTGQEMMKKLGLDDEV